MDFGRRGILSYVSVTPAESSTLYFVCSAHCATGQKISITHDPTVYAAGDLEADAVPSAKMTDLEPALAP